MDEHTPDLTEGLTRPELVVLATVAQHAVARKMALKADAVALARLQSQGIDDFQITVGTMVTAALHPLHMPAARTVTPFAADRRLIKRRVGEGVGPLAGGGVRPACVARQAIIPHPTFEPRRLSGGIARRDIPLLRFCIP